jgi:3-methyladenine DNA glycosylase AlkD
MTAIIDKIRKELKLNGNEKNRKSGLGFFKEEVKLYGVKTATVSKIAKENFKSIKDKNKSEILNLCEELWKSGYMEESFIACNWSYFIHKDYEPKDFTIFQKWVNNYVGNWASCDTLCNHTIGTFIEMYPKYLSELKKWTKSKNRWMRRASAVTLIIPAKRGKFLKEVFEIADTLLLDKDDMVQKGYGWMLKVASQAHQKEIFNYVISKKSTMPRTALRYAIEKMPKELRTKAMTKNNN